MANHIFTAEIKDIKRELDNISDRLVSLNVDIAEYFGEASQSASQCETVIDHLEDTLNSLVFLDRLIPRSYTPESHDRGASKLENRINRLERLMKK